VLVRRAADATEVIFEMTGRMIRLAVQSSRRLMRETLGVYLASGPGFAVV
jgi:hypothetical protein